MVLNKKTTLQLVSLWLPVIIQMGLIFYLSSLPAGSPALESFPVPGWLGHFAGYGLLALLLYRAFNRGFRGWSFKAAVSTFVVGFLYALSDEFHQMFVPGRHALLADIAIDTGGILSALLFLRVVAGQLSKKFPGY